MREVEILVVKNILVVEDEIIVAKSIQERLSKLGYAVPAVVPSGSEALKEVEKIHPDLVLMDIKLEGDMDGIETAEQIRSRFDIPIVYLTAYADEEILQRAKVTEPFGYIVKPFEERELYGNIEIALYKHKMEKKLKENRNHLNNIINSTSELIMVFDKNNRISNWNKAAEQITGFKRRDVIRKHFNKLMVFNNPEIIVDKIQSLVNGEHVKFDDLILRDKYGAKRIIQISYSLVKGIKDEDMSVLLVGKDITSERYNQKKLVKGKGYLIPTEEKDYYIDFFNSLAKLGNKNLFITRGKLDILKNKTSSVDTQIVLLQENKLEDFENISDINELINKIKEFTIKNDNSVILLDRIDYLLTKFSFEIFTNALYKINEIISNSKSIFLLNVPSSMLDKKQMAIIENELQIIPSKDIKNIEIEDELFNILKFIDEQNKNNLMVSFKKIRKIFSLAYSTTAIKLNILSDKDLIVIKKYGRFKKVNITEKGKSLLVKRKIH
jgi:PAS domain S-box-containing protein